MTDLESERLDTALRFLGNRHAYVAAAVIRLGELHFNDQVETSCIVADGHKVRLYFNREFFNGIEAMELAGVLVHEAMHFCLRHQERHQAIRHQRDRHLFKLACEAVINDLIAACFKDLKLPGEPVTGRSLLGRDVSRNSAEEVMGFLRERIAEQPTSAARLMGMDSLDDHSVWEESSPLSGNAPDDSPISGNPPLWTEETSLIADKVLDEFGEGDIVWGTVPLGRDRALPAKSDGRKDLSRFLLDSLRTLNRYDTDWTRPNRKLVSVYPKVILPNYESIHHYRVLIAIDASGSVPTSFLAAAPAVAHQLLANTTVTLVSFDTKVYPIEKGKSSVTGGGGTSAQAVEEFILEKMPFYPDAIFCLTDGFFALPRVKHPDRWVWILPPWGSNTNLPPLGRVEIFLIDRGERL